MSFWLIIGLVTVSIGIAVVVHFMEEKFGDQSNSDRDPPLPPI